MSEPHAVPPESSEIVYSLIEDIDGIEIAARYRRGDDPLLVYLHGWGRSLADFAPYLGRGPWSAVALDLPGFGRSTPPLRPMGARGYAELLREPLASLRRRLQASRMILVGHSFGGRIAAEFAGLATDADALAGVVIVASPLLRPQGGRPALGYRVVRSLHAAHLVPATALEWARGRWGSTDYRQATGVMRDVLVRTVNEQHLGALERARVPVELVWGALDTACPVPLAERVAARVAGANLDIRAGVGHDVPRDAPEAVWGAIHRLLGRIEPPVGCEEQLSE
ncbi:alpha/beta hydrolase fold protein [Acidimicrobium ferrooxidans DSM 10331]|uniref:Alpha/beta hydrolase fold protein n=1 Tax=Acidimicrobium ferrooxidans (strain DSM 10331 / JCM 15462 / NBRC 103882 / ICP) TaxID=525909 RepID=C7LXU3_ACIFD|nr:alpha/beta hydrolase [Acidimicrobium ferrooxidans]ACU53551.1 alpha/beta hydrolase fold protein [Acidimicrobium ferrooxidans DSM 10331]